MVGQQWRGRRHQPPIDRLSETQDSEDVGAIYRYVTASDGIQLGQERVTDFHVRGA